MIEDLTSPPQPMVEDLTSPPTELVMIEDLTSLPQQTQPMVEDLTSPPSKQQQVVSNAPRKRTAPSRRTAPSKSVIPSERSALKSAPARKSKPPPTAPPPPPIRRDIVSITAPAATITSETAPSARGFLPPRSAKLNQRKSNSFEGAGAYHKASGTYIKFSTQKKGIWLSNQGRKVATKSATSSQTGSNGVTSETVAGRGVRTRSSVPGNH